MSVSLSRKLKSMANNPSLEQPEFPQLQERLEQLETRGFPRPNNCLLSDYLRFLAEHDLLPHNTADDIASLYYRARYGNAPTEAREVEAREWEATLADLDASLALLSDADETWRQSLAEQLREQFSTVETVTVQASEDKEPEPPPAPLPTAIPPWEQTGESIPQTQPPKTKTRRWVFAGGALLSWTVIMIAAGYSYRAQITASLRQVGAIPKSPKQTRISNNWPKMLRETRLAIMHGKNRFRLDRNLGFLIQRHQARKEYAETYYIWERQLARNPNDSMLKYTLAQHLLSAQDVWYRDPIRALRLAEEAVQIRRRRVYLDTLAEACHQTGDHHRAIELEEEILASNPRRESHYRERLLKFRNALSNSETELTRTESR